MGELIVLPRTERPSRSAPSIDHSAEILFFTGVRYYRMADDAAPPVKTRRRRRPAIAKARAELRIDAHA